MVDLSHKIGNIDSFNIDKQIRSFELQLSKAENKRKVQIERLKHNICGGTQTKKRKSKQI